MIPGPGLQKLGEVPKSKFFLPMAVGCKDNLLDKCYTNWGGVFKFAQKAAAPRKEWGLWGPTWGMSGTKGEENRSGFSGVRVWLGGKLKPTLRLQRARHGSGGPRRRLLLRQTQGGRR